MPKIPPPEPLPEPTVQYVSYGQYWQLTPEQVAAIACNPVYTGIGPYPPLVDEERWVRAAAKQIELYGPTQFLVNMLYVLRHAFEWGVDGPDIAGLPPMAAKREPPAQEPPAQEPPARKRRRAAARS